MIHSGRTPKGCAALFSAKAPRMIINMKAFVFGIVATVTLLAHGYADIKLSWGVNPKNDQTTGCNGTCLFTGNSEMDVDAFNDRFELRLAYVGTGGFDESEGYASMRWVSSASAVKRSEQFPGDNTFNGEFIAERRESFAMETLGDIEEDDPDGLLDEYDYYWERWMDGAFVVVVREKATGTTYRISAEDGGFDRVSESRLNGTFALETNLMTPPSVNRFYQYATNSQQRVYLGAPLPARCVWMADQGLTTNDLEGVSDRRIALATALGKAPNEVADVTLRIDGFDPETGTVSYGFDAEAPDGTKSAVTKLWYGAELRLLSGTELGRWTTTNIVDVAGRTVVAPTGGDARFYRLELAVP